MFEYIGDSDLIFVFIYWESIKLGQKYVDVAVVGLSYFVAHSMFVKHGLGRTRHKMLLFAVSKITVNHFISTQIKRL